MMSAIPNSVSRGEVSSTLSKGPKNKNGGDIDLEKKVLDPKDVANMGELLNKISTHPKKEGEAAGSPLAGKTLGKEDFLKFFMASLKNQDPSKPVDGEQFSSQMAQFSSLEQLVNLNKGIEKLVDGNKQDRSVQAMSLVGKEVAVDASRLEVKNGMLKPIPLVLPNDVSKLTVTVSDSNGTGVKILSFENKSKGNMDVIWDGKMDDGTRAPDGKYTFKAEITSADGKKSIVNTEKRMIIDGVDLNSKGDQLYSGDLTIKMEDVHKVFSEKKKEPSTKEVLDEHVQSEVVSKKSSGVAAGVSAGAAAANFKKLG